MNTTFLARAASLLAVLCWIAKATAVGLAGGPDRSPLETPLFLVGLLLAICAGVMLALAATGGRPLWQRIAAGVLTVPLTFGIATAVDQLVKVLVSSTHWVWSEVNLWVMGALLLSLAWRPRGQLAQPHSMRHRLPG
jgi:hypothetical protein